MKNNGFDGLPQKVTDVDDLIPVYRGIVDFKYGDDTSQDQIDRFLRSHFDISGARSSANGRGVILLVPNLKHKNMQIMAITAN